MNRLQAAGVGAQVIADWFGEGGEPVAREVAERRSQACIAGNNGQPCHANQPGNWWDWIASSAVQVAMARRRAKEALRLAVPNEDKLYFCNICHCDLKTKTLVPMKHIEKHTNSAVWAQLPYWCWMRKEKGE